MFKLCSILRHLPILAYIHKVIKFWLVGGLFVFNIIMRHVYVHTFFQEAIVREPIRIGSRPKSCMEPLTRVQPIPKPRPRVFPQTQTPPKVVKQHSRTPSESTSAADIPSSLPTSFPETLPTVPSPAPPYENIRFSPTIYVNVELGHPIPAPRHYSQGNSS